MAKHKEIEVKWSSDDVERKHFNREMRALLKKLDCSFRFLRVKGPDTYYVRGRDVVRHRISKNTHELTIKRRIYKKSIRARKEVNVQLALSQPIEDVVAFLDDIGFERQVRLVKDCDIYFIVMPSGVHASIVWYVVEADDGSMKRFIEVEIEGQSHHRSLASLDFWCKKIEKIFRLGRSDRSDDSLYEIYTGKRYKNVSRRVV